MNPRQWIGIDISPTAPPPCRVMAKRLKDVCKMRKSEPGASSRIIKHKALFIDLCAVKGTLPYARTP
jgi:hypothetical protein